MVPWRTFSSLILVVAIWPTACVQLLASRAASLEAKDRPVMKVVRLLQDMRDQLQKELDDDKAVHEQLDCWCKKNDQEKTQAIETGEAKTSELNSFLGEAAAQMAEMKSKRDSTFDEINKDEAALQEARTLRMKENQQFHADEANLMEAVKACSQAVEVLSKHNAGFAQVRAVAQRLRSARVLEIAHKSRGGRDTLALKAFLLDVAGSGQSFLGIPGYQSYAPQSGQVYGVLQQMQSDFEKDLEEARAKEEKDAKDHSELKAAKTEEIKVGTDLHADFEQQIADLKEKHAQAFQELEDTQKQLDFDRIFLANLKKKCSASEAEFDQRIKDRMEEIVAVEDTIKIINDDQAFENFDKTVNAALVQTRSVSSSRERLNRAAAVLTDAAARTGRVEMALLATRAKLDVFTKVKEEIDKMISELQRQQQDEIEHRDWCIDELAKNNRSLTENYDAKTNLETKIADLKKTSEYLTKQIQETTASVGEMREQMKRASENRERENADYQQTIIDQRLTQNILAKALDRMKQVYVMLQQDDQPGAPHIQTSGNHTDAGNAPARFTKYEQNAGGSRVVQMIQTVIADSLKSENEAIASEQDAQTAYESFIQDSNKEITVYNEKIMHMKGSLAKAKEDLNMATGDLKGTVKSLEDLHDTKGGLHKSCDFVKNTFDDRQAARTDEVNALREAKAILSGMK